MKKNKNINFSKLLSGLSFGKFLKKKDKASFEKLLKDKGKLEQIKHMYEEGYKTFFKDIKDINRETDF